MRPGLARITFYSCATAILAENDSQAFASMPYETDFRSTLPRDPIHVTEHIWVGYPAHIEIPEVGSDFWVDALIIHAALPVGLEGPRYILPEELFGDDVVQPDSSPAEMMDAVATRLREWVDHEFDMSMVKGTYPALQLLRNLTKTGDPLATRVLKTHIRATLANGSPKARIDLIAACYDVLSRKDVYDLLGDPDPNVRSATARSCIPLRPRDPGDDFIPPGLADLTPDEKTLVDVMRKNQQRNYSYHTQTGEFAGYISEKKPGEKYSHTRSTRFPIPSINTNLIGTIESLTIKRVILSEFETQKNTIFFKPLDW